MSSVLDLHPAPGRVAAVAAAVHEVLDAAAGDVEDLAPGEHASVVAELARARARIQALELKVVAAASRAGVARDAGCASTGAWLAGVTRSSGAAAARDTHLARDLAERLPATQDVLGQGVITTEHAAVVAHAVARLPRGLTDGQVGEVELRLVEHARRVDPTRLRRLARRALAAVEADQRTVDAHEDGQVRDEERDALARTKLTLHDNLDGTVSGHFTVPILAGAILRKVLDAMTSPRRGRLGAARAQVGDPRESRDWAHERGLAFAQLLEHLPTDRLPSRTAATVVVTLDLEILRGQLRAAGLDTGDLVSAAEARRLACTSGLVPAVLGGASMPLDLGRHSRLFTEAQRLAGATLHTSCAADGCEVPYAWCDLHHRRPWSRDGRSDLANLDPLCGFHHRRIHDPDHQHRRRPDGSIRFHRRT